MRVLHVIATPRAESSNTLHVSRPFLARLTELHPALEVETLDLFGDPLPELAGANTRSKYAILRGEPVATGDTTAWSQIEELVAQFRRADVCLISAPMWNFSIPHVLKHYIDSIVQPGYLFEYDETGTPHGLCQSTRLVCITSRGGDYSRDTPMHAFDLQEGYFRALFGFLGVERMDFVNAQPMDITPELRQAALEQAVAAALTVAESVAVASGEGHEVGVVG